MKVYTAYLSFITNTVLAMQTLLTFIGMFIHFIIYTQSQRKQFAVLISIYNTSLTKFLKRVKETNFLKRIFGLILIFYIDEYV